MAVGAKAPETITEAGTQRRARFVSWLAFGVLIVAAILWVIPLLWAVDTALKPENQTTTVPITWIPKGGFTFESFWQVLTAGGLVRWYFNSALTSSIITAAVLLLTSLAAFGLSRVPFRGRTVVFWVIIAGLMIPPQVLIIPLFMEMDALKFVDTYQGIILPQIASPLGVFIFKQFFDGIPPDLEEAAIVDGASRFRVYWQIWMPLARPAIAAVALFQFLYSWNDFFSPLLYAGNNPDAWTLAISLQQLTQLSRGILANLQMAASILFTLPVLVIFFLAQKVFVEGVTLTGVKG
jgi:multiple sugar transport system permease protein